MAMRSAAAVMGGTIFTSGSMAMKEPLQKQATAKYKIRFFMDDHNCTLSFDGKIQD
ncbi:MAG: hypothetical protein QE271_00395 [Bacteriovoracaceae bacterium]|nr:hypothetical protein [Bacteriovoracaceae bacterium]